MIKVNIGTEIAPIVGSEEQANDLKKYIDENTKKGDAWDINIFGKTIEQLVDDGIRTKANKKPSAFSGVFVRQLNRQKA